MDTNKVEFPVEEKHIIMGRINQMVANAWKYWNDGMFSCFCPVALAAKDAGYENPSVSPNGLILVDSNSKYTYYYHSTWAHIQITSFDQEGIMRPFTYVAKEQY